MSEENSDGDDVDRTRTTIKVDREVWRQVRSDAVADGKNVSEKLEEVLEDYYDMGDDG
jgi:hypothetical protein